MNKVSNINITNRNFRIRIYFCRKYTEIAFSRNKLKLANNLDNCDLEGTINRGEEGAWASCNSPRGSACSCTCQWWRKGGEEVKRSSHPGVKNRNWKQWHNQCNDCTKRGEGGISESHIGSGDSNNNKWIRWRFEASRRCEPKMI